MTEKKTDNRVIIEQEAKKENFFKRHAKKFAVGGIALGTAVLGGIVGGIIGGNRAEAYMDGALEDAGILYDNDEIDSDDLDVTVTEF